MEINNLELISKLLKWEDHNDFYFIQILRRKKENPDNTSNSTLIKTYYINSLEHLYNRFDEMRLLSRFHNARVYINLNKRNYEQLGLQMIKKVSDCLINKAYSDIKNSYNSVCGSISSEKEKKWIVDLDNVSLDEECLIHNTITNLEGTIYAYIPTINGKHMITSPFNTSKFRDKLIYDSIKLNKPIIIPDIQKNNPTLLYYSDNKININ